MNEKLKNFLDEYLVLNRVLGGFVVLYTLGLSLFFLQLGTTVKVEDADISVFLSSMYITASFFSAFLIKDAFSEFVSSKLKSHIFYFITIFSIGTIFEAEGVSIKDYATSNPQIMISLFVGILFSTIIYKTIFKNNGSHSMAHGVSEGPVGFSSSSSIPHENKFNLNKEKEIEFTAIHEAGHAMIHAALKRLPDNFEINILGDSRSLGFVRGYSENDLRMMKDKRWFMYMTLGGNCAELLYLKDGVFGSKSDLRRWEALAANMLIHSKEVHYFSDPKNNLEINHNANVLKKLRKGQSKNIVRFFKKNHDVMDRLIEELKERKVLKKEDFSKYLSEINCEDLPCPTI